MTEPTKIERAKLRDAILRIFGTLSGAMAAAMVQLGGRLGLYQAMQGAGPIDSQALAKKTGLDERWIREWLRTQGAAGILAHHGDERFELTPEAACILADERHPAFAMGFFEQIPTLMSLLEKLPDAFRSGLGLPYDALGPEGARGIERGLAPWFRTFLVPAVLPKLDGVVEKLERGALVADVGCGGGVALLEMAKKYPRSEFHGYDISRHALERAERNKTSYGVENAIFHDARSDGLPDDGRFDLVTSIDCIHDMTRPEDVIRAIHTSLRGDGTWLVIDIKGRPTYEEIARDNPMAAMMYGFSVLTCMSSALSEPGGAGLGTFGFHEDVARSMATAAGFSRFRRLEIDHPMNAFYEARP
jgi:2-polyprenyl-3-methyl-5-hydroxy-6-metoxy-1,4-benzoquinol methylase